MLWMGGCSRSFIPPRFRDFVYMVFTHLIRNTFKPNNDDMEVKNAFAGTLESGDILVQITPSEDESLQIDLDSTVEYQFGGQIRKVIKETLEEMGVDKAHVKATDKGALDCTIRARVTAAAVRATGKDVWKD